MDNYCRGNTRVGTTRAKTQLGEFMPVTYDPLENEIWLNGKAIGTLTEDDGKYNICMTIEYSFQDPAKRIEFLSALSTVIDKFELSENVYILLWECAENDINPIETELQLLEEATISLKGSKWRFHKNDADHWPSKLHGHSLEGRKVIDGITGNIFDKSTRKKTGRLKKKALLNLQSTLKSNKDLGPTARKFIGNNSK